MAEGAFNSWAFIQMSEPSFNRMSRHSTGAARRRDWAPPRALPAGAPASRRNAEGATLQAGEGLPLAELLRALGGLSGAPWPASAAAGARGLPAFPGARRLTRPRPSTRGASLEARASKGHGATLAELATPARSKCPRCCLAAGALQAQERARTPGNARTLTGEAVPLPSCCGAHCGLSGAMHGRNNARRGAARRCPCGCSRGCISTALPATWWLHGGYTVKG